ncbi:hypothetical protein CCZ01_06920 [Helicobacter monodelphidis]|uniref:TolC family protein n=1 Tax=Helicobacter sp. 15-1451 TaxID=2004995 RepID=UPI000DCC1EB1|nr:TolC family protein [Helicobacter sp. 15-1451]RAX57190.1 hypothetical protein CCZ01_06920 [Helicobacter sp. 15-1451]
MQKFLFVISFFIVNLCPTPLCALNIQEAISLALTKSHTLKEQEYLLEEVEYNLKIAEGQLYYPTLDANIQVQNTEDSNSIRGGNIATLQLRYNLFNGFADINNLESQTSLLNVQQYTLKATKQDLILAIKTAYIQLLQQKHQLIVAEESVKLLEQQHKETAEFYRVGIVPKNDVLKVEVQLSNAKQNLLSAKSTLTYMQKDLERYIGEKFHINDLEEVRFHLSIKTFESLQDIMLYSRSELKALEQQLESKRYIIEGAKSDYYPSIDIVGEQSFSQKNTNTQSQTSAKLEISMNLFSGFSTTNDIQAKRSNMLSLNSQIAALKEELDLQLLSAYESYTLAISAYDVAKEALEQAEENYRIASNRYKERIETTSNFLDAELLLTQAKTNLLINRYGISQAIARIIRITELEEK